MESSHDLRGRMLLWKRAALDVICYVQGQVGQGFEQPGLVECVPAHGRGLEQDDL